MKAITVHQPWASLIAHGYKTIETRTHNQFANLKGLRIAIHAGKTFDTTAREYAGRYLWRRGKEIWSAAHPLLNQLGCPLGMVVCTALVADVRPCAPNADNDKALCDTDGLYGLVLTDVRRLDPPVPVRGQQGAWNWENGNGHE